jgi:hypothetical protein
VAVRIFVPFVPDVVGISSTRVCAVAVCSERFAQRGRGALRSVVTPTEVSDRAAYAHEDFLWWSAHAADGRPPPS